MDVWEYFEQRERECLRLSLVADPDLPNAYNELEGSCGKRGRIFARLLLTDRAFMNVMERVVVTEDDAIHREEYAYYLVVDEEEVFARDRDLDHDPPEHGHGPDHERVEDPSISFKAFAEKCWEIVSDLPPEDE